jgi:LacI family repressor for deo operon, udp, cdd, tsx, nupC, and nupG
MAGKQNTPTIQHVAREAGVSTATVSRALTNPERVSDATRERVALAVSKTGYTVNQSARSLRVRAARTLLIALPNIGNPYYSTILDAVVHEAASREYGVLVANRLGADPNHWLRHFFFSNRADGLLLFDGSLDPNLFQDLPSRDGVLPLVISCDEVPGPGMHCVLTDNFEAAKRATRHLIELGHRRIGHVIGRSKNASPSERMLGFRAAMAEAGLAVPDEWVVSGDFSMPSGIPAGEHYAQLRSRPSAVFCGNDEMAIGMIVGLRAHGLDCPRDISIVGFDDITVAAHYPPPLTTMRQPREAMGRAATKMLINILEGEHRPGDPCHIVLKSHLVVRASTAPYIEATR